MPLPIAPEFRVHWLSLAAALAVLVMASHRWLWPLWGLLAVLAFLWRDPRRRPPADPLAVLAPVDGRVLAVERATDPWLDRPAWRVRLRQSPLGPFALFSPTEGKLMEHWRRGRRDQEGALYACWLRTDEDDDVTLVIDLRRWPRALRSPWRVGERLGQGQRCGLAGYGVVVSVYLPAGAAPTVVVGERLRGGRDVLGKFVHEGS